ncbi:MAG: trigger factor [Patescibacteria group bacterium]
MYSYKKEKLPKNTNIINIEVPKEDIIKEEGEAFTRLQQQLTVEGFRLGKAPKNIAEKHISKEDLYQELAQKLVSRIYKEILTKEALKPIVSPKVDLVKANEGEDWHIRITIAEKPTISLGDYKKVIKETKAKAEKSNIWVPGKDKDPSANGKKPEEDKNKLLNEVLSALLNEAKIEVSDLVIDEEINHRLTHLMDEIQKIGLTVENYLKSKNLTMDSLKAQFKKETEDTYKLEFALSEIADKENLKVEQADLDKLFVNIKDENERKKAEQNSYYYATILRKQKTLDYLISL